MSNQAIKDAKLERRRAARRATCFELASRRSVWSDLLTRDMTPEHAAAIMGVSAGVAESELRRAREERSASERWADKEGQVLESQYPLDALRKYGVRQVPWREISRNDP